MGQLFWLVLKCTSVLESDFLMPLVFYCSIECSGDAGFFAVMSAEVLSHSGSDSSAWGRLSRHSHQWTHSLIWNGFSLLSCHFSWTISGKNNTESSNATAFSCSFQNRTAFYLSLYINIYITKSRDKARYVVVSVLTSYTGDFISRHSLLEPAAIWHRFGALVAVGWTCLGENSFSV